MSGTDIGYGATRVVTGAKEPSRVPLTRFVPDMLSRVRRQIGFCLTHYAMPGTAVPYSSTQAPRDTGAIALCTQFPVNSALGATPGPWFLGGDAPSLVDFQY
eukprot:3236894-Rhodomonas_salina.1